MHTYFINISSINVEDYEKVLLDVLIAEKKLMVMKRCTDLCQLEVYPKSISEAVEAESDIFDSIRVVVYYELPVPPVRMSELIQRQALQCAQEELLALRVMHALALPLAQSLKELIIIYGEHSSRERYEAVSESLYINTWKLLGLEDPDRVAEALLDRQEKAPALENILCKSEAEEVQRDVFANRVLSLLVKNVSDRLADINDLKCSQTDRAHQLEGAVRILYCALANALTVCKESLNADFRRFDLPDPRYAHLFLGLNSDSVNRKRKEACLLLNLRRIAGCADSVQYMRTASEPQYACPLPALDAEAFRSELVNKLAMLEAGADFPSIIPPWLAAPQEANVGIVLEHEKPQLKTDFQFSFHLRTGALRKEVNQCFKDLREKDQKNNEAITSYVRKVSSEYNRVKYHRLQEIRNRFIGQMPNAAMMAASVDEAAYERSIDELADKELEYEKLQNYAERCVLNPARGTTEFDGDSEKEKSDFVPVASMSEQIDDTRRSVDQLFGLLGRDLRLLFVAFLTEVCFLLPYFILRSGIWGMKLYWQAFTLTGAIVLAAFIIGDLLYIRSIKKRIVKMVQDLVGAFNRAHENNEQRLTMFQKLLQRTIPECYALSYMLSEIEQYRSRLERRKCEITYHRKETNMRKDGIRWLLNAMGFPCETNGAAVPGRAAINPERDIVDNKEFYEIEDDELYSAMLPQEDNK